MAWEGPGDRGRAPSLARVVAALPGCGLAASPPYTHSGETPKPAPQTRGDGQGLRRQTHHRRRRPSSRDASSWGGQGVSVQTRPRVRGDYPPNLSILLSGGKETNRDSPSRCDRTGMSPACSLDPPLPGARGMPRSGGSPSGVPARLSPLERGHYPRRVRGPYALSPGAPERPFRRVGLLETAAQSRW